MYEKMYEKRKAKRWISVNKGIATAVSIGLLVSTCLTLGFAVGTRVNNYKVNVGLTNLNYDGLVKFFRKDEIGNFVECNPYEWVSWMDTNKK